MKRPTSKIKKEIAKLHFEKGISQTQLAKDYGISRRSIIKYCLKTGKSPLKKDYLLNDREIIRLYVEEKRSVLQISSILGITPRPITRRLRLAGIEKRVSKRNAWTKEVPHYHLKMKIWTAKVIDRDRMVCKMCGAENTFANRLEANHIIPVREMKTPDLLFALENGITLCRKCHMKIHYHEHEYEISFRNMIRGI